MRKFIRINTLSILKYGASAALMLMLIVPQAPLAAQEQNANETEQASTTSTLLQQPTHGIAMHGAPKYSADATHLDYANPNAPKGGTLKQSVIGSFDTLNANNIKGKPAAGLSYLYDRLAARVWDEPFGLYGLVAEHIIIPLDRSSITFQINPQARFHDGTPITAHDVAFSYETLKTYGRPNVRRVYKLVDHVDITSDHEITFNFTPDHDQETALIIAMMPVLPAHYWQDRDFDSTTMDAPLGSGPYRITEAEAGRRIVYERVADYWAQDHLVNKGHYNFDRLIFDYYRDKNVAIQAFKSGEFDIFRDFDVASWHNNFAKTDDETYTAKAMPHQRPEWVRAFIFNTQNSKFTDPSVREALALAFDFEWMNKTLFHSMTKRITSTFPNTNLAASNDLAVFSDELDIRTRLRRADQLLQAAGWIIKDNKRVNEASGEILEFSILLNDSRFEKVALHWAQHLKRLGVEIKVETVDSARFTGLLNDYDYDIVLHRWVNSLSPGTEQQIYWGCTAAKNKGSRNYARLCQPEIDDLAAKIAQATSREMLVEHVRKLDTAIMKAHIMVPLYYIGQDYVAYDQRLSHPQETALYGMVLETWWQNQPLDQDLNKAE